MKSGSSYEFELELPAVYRSREVLAFHARDPEGSADRVEQNRICKGILLNKIPSLFELSLQAHRATCQVNADGNLPESSRNSVQEIASNLLGLSINPSPFEREFRQDQLLGPLIRKQTGLHIPQTATPFEALTWAIIGQQINLSFAISLRRTFIQLTSCRHSSGIWCYPEAADVAKLDPEMLMRSKFSRSKAEALIRVAQLVDSGALPLNQLKTRPREEIETSLLAVKGIGPWTVNYTLLRGFGNSDCSLHGDAAVRKAIQVLLRSDARPTADEIEFLLRRYKPYRSLVSAHLWASLNP